jgi:hypothetical protein
VKYGDPAYFRQKGVISVEVKLHTIATWLSEARSDVARAEGALVLGPEAPDFEKAADALIRAECIAREARFEVERLSGEAS